MIDNQTFIKTRYIVVVKKTFRYSNVFSYNHLYQPECFYEKGYKSLTGNGTMPVANRLIRFR